ncbi:hypothetical protein V5F53_20135 [Xanthobacter sp. V4C-4]|uniref:hypothetical protein n=1 Tax=Xanthobacter cornucopiae TaxID=3119924 RepID=UPI00372C035B
MAHIDPPLPRRTVPGQVRVSPPDGLPPPGKPLAARLWSRVLDMGLVLWVVRIPLASLVLGLLLMLAVTQAQDTLVDVAMSGAPLAQAAGLSQAILGLLAATFVLWAIPLHYAARLLLETDDGIAALRRRRAAETTPRGSTDRWTSFILRQTPRLLGALTFAAFAIGAVAAVANLPTLVDAQVARAARAQLQLIAWVMLAAVPVFFAYAALRGRLIRIGPFQAADAAVGRACAGLFRALGITARADDPSGELHATGRLLLLAYALGVVAILVANPLWLAGQLPLALAVPLIFGGWVPILSYLASIGRRWRFPFVTALLLLGAAGVYLIGDNHRVRTLTATAPSYQRTTIDTAAFLWMRANGCAEAPATCPRPIIVAAAGGASRAGFFTASVIGHFLDFARHADGFTLTRADGSKLVRGAWDDARISPQAAQALANVDIATRIFAISGVSGGAYGAAATAAALEARASGAPPCAAGPAPQWFGGRVTTWQDCLESLTSGDYLTAAFFGLAFHDQVQAFLEDRAALLEQSWERRFAEVVTPPDAAMARRMAAPFLAKERDPSHWVPFLVLNGTSVETGQRIVTTDLQPTYSTRRPCPSGGARSECPLFTHAIDFHGLVRADLDVRLSTAALNSARFPVISPPGSIYQVEKDVVDRIVDGGYFENFGAASALELAQALVDVAPQLAPFILVISNDPGSTLTEERTARAVVVPDAAEHVWFSEATSPIGAIGTVRSGRGRLAVAEAGRWLEERFGTGCRSNLAHIKVWPEALDGTCPVGVATPKAIRDVSMSWWLSKPVQMNLREQLEHTGDRCNNDAAVAAVWQALATPSSACLAGR